jgi:hypothetical protein
MPENSFQRTSQQLLDISPLDFYLWGNLKTVVYSAPSENEGTIHQRIFYACQTLRDSQWSDVSIRALIQVEDVLSICNSTVITLGACIVIVLCQL